MNPTEKERENFPGYVPKKKNRLVVVLADFCFAGTSTPVDADQSKEKAEEFIKLIIKTSKECKFEVEGYGTKEQMAARLNKRNGKELFTEEEAEKYATFCTNFLTAFYHDSDDIGPLVYPSIQEWKDQLEIKSID